ncbi:MAG: tRNA-dihydrouridine synthase family protein [Victivallales bacterium]
MNNIYPANSIILAPLSGYTDLPYRNSARRFGCGFCFTEMIDAGSLAYGNSKTTRLVDRGPGEEWLGVQLVGSDHGRIKLAVEILNEHDFDVLDFNLGCPVPKVAKKGAGAVLGQNIDEALRCFDIIKKKSRHRLCAKIRILDENDPEPTLKLAKGLADAGAEALTVHGRIRSRFYSGPVNFEMIAAVRAALDIQVIANGGVTGAASYTEIREKTACDIVMLARGAMGNPWLFRELADPENYLPPTPGELADELERHIREMIDYYGEALGLRVARKIILDYLRGRGFPGKVKNAVSFLNKTEDFAEFMELVREGPSGRYRQWLKTCPEADRRLEI